MRLRRSRNPINQSSSASQRLSGRKVHNQLRNQHLLLRVRKGGPSRARVSTVHRHLPHPPALRFCDTGCELASEVQKEAFGAPVLVCLCQPIFVITQVSDVRALLGNRHGGRGGINAECGDEGEDWRRGVCWGGFEDWKQEEGEKGGREVVHLDCCKDNLY
jgi:hypothetical protein